MSHCEPRHIIDVKYDEKNRIANTGTITITYDDGFVITMQNQQYQTYLDMLSPDKINKHIDDPLEQLINKGFGQ
jgi:hypothetical protein